MPINLTNNRLTNTLKELSKRHEPALICYVVAGYPSLPATEDIISSVVSAGADVIEIGIPFSDPIADGSIIQEATHNALMRGITPKKCLDLSHHIRTKFPRLPILAMTYSNILSKAGFKNFMIRSKRSGIDGFILADMTIEESDCYVKHGSRLDLATIFLASPNTSEQRMSAIVEKSSGFVYLVSTYGVTGTRRAFESYTLYAIRNAKRIVGSYLPIAVGFGITRPSHVRFMIKAGADAVIVGSAIIEKIKSNSNDKTKMLENLSSYITSMKRACKQ